MQNDPDPATTPRKPTPPGPPITADTAREMQARSAAARRANKEREREQVAAAAKLDKLTQRLEAQLGEARAQLLEQKADARAARAEAAALRRRLEEQAAALAKAQAAHGTRRTEPTDPAEMLDSAATGAMHTLRAVLRALATAARTGELVRSGADAAALLDGIVRAAAAVQALQERAAVAPGRRRPAAIEAAGQDLGALVEKVRANLAGAVVEADGR
ncbi:MAG: hypothetical protein RL134_2521 [Actinomycetota bacterium]|jgi:hypothetical protein